MIRIPSLRTAALPAVVLVLLAALLGTACRGLATGNESEAAVEAARGAGLQPYWLGDSFGSRDVQARVSSSEHNDALWPHFAFSYRLGADASGLMIIQTFAESEQHWRKYLDRSRTIPKLSIRAAQVGAWSGELWLMGSGQRPVNTLKYVLHIDGMVVLATAKASSTGVPETDLNPLIDAELWAQVLEEHLQPYLD